MTTERDTLFFKESHNEDNYIEEDSSFLNSSKLTSFITTGKDTEKASWKQIFKHAWNYLFPNNKADDCRPDRLEYDYVPPKESKILQLRLKYDEKTVRITPDGAYLRNRYKQKI